MTCARSLQVCFRLQEGSQVAQTRHSYSQNIGRLTPGFTQSWLGFMALRHHDYFHHFRPKLALVKSIAHPRHRLR